MKIVKNHRAFRITRQAELALKKSSEIKGITQTALIEHLLREEYFRLAELGYLKLEELSKTEEQAKQVDSAYHNTKEQTPLLTP